MELLYWLIPIVLILIVIFFKIEFKIIMRDATVKVAKRILKAVLIIACAFAVIYPIVYALFWINSNLGAAIFVLAFIYIIFAIFSLLMKYKEKLLASLLGTYLFTKIKIFLTSMSLFIKTPIGFITISFGSITWISVSNPYFREIITIPLPAYIWAIAGVILCWGITSMVGSLVNTIKSIFFKGKKAESKVK